jgi:3-phytase
MACKDGGGYWIGTDQFKDRSLFHVFDRRTLAPVGEFAGRLTANTDGVWLDAHGDERFPRGVMYALHDDQAVAAFDWRDIAAALKLKACAE